MKGKGCRRTILVQAGSFRNARKQNSLDKSCGPYYPILNLVLSLEAEYTKLRKPKNIRHSPLSMWILHEINLNSILMP